MVHIIPSAPADDTNPTTALTPEREHEIRAARHGVRSLASVDIDVTDLLMEVTRLRAELSARPARAEVLAQAIEAARAEHLDDDTGTAEDEAYNQGVDDAVAAVGALWEAAPAPSPRTEPLTVEHGLSFGNGNVVMAGSDEQFDDRAVRAGAVRVTRTVSPWTEVAS
ncbi:hypothetical protein ABZ622_39335 [Streptomyces sp. NPDC007164]|uniref:hypothetical protein n=1 Tax=Streptomyces sp. NPDC007164 TaxID=3156918 RepID=UPI003402AC8E